MRRRLLLLVPLGLAGLAAVGVATGVPGDVTPPVFSPTPDITAEATGPGGAPVSFDPTATDPSDPPPGPSEPVTVTCNPTSGTVFTLGSTPVSCAAEDAEGNDAVATDGTGLFDVIVQDTTAPTFAGVPADQTVSAGDTVTYTVPTASDLVDGDVPVTCNPASPFTATVTTEVECDASDARSNSASATFTVEEDSDAPVVSVPEDMTVEGNTPGGAFVVYEAPGAIDTVDGPIPPEAITCTKPSGAFYPLGTTLVTCSARDSGDLVGSASFLIAVEDTTPPVLTAPTDITLQSSSPVAASDPRLAAFLASASATDIVDQDVEVSNDAPAAFGLGVTLIVFTARDDSGNTTQERAQVTITTDPVGPPSPEDTTPPGNVRGVKAVGGDLSVSIRWRPPAASDFHHVTITRSPGLKGAPESVLYTGRKTSFVARGLEDGVEYRFVIVAHDEAGNRSAGVAVVVLAERQTLLAPVNGATITAPRRFVWRAAAGASYYNIQFWRNGKKLSAWPVKATFTLRSRWRFEGRHRRLAPGTWHVYVWPGFGPKRSARYGDLHVDATFVVRRHRP
jgi:hypothetical protein